MTPAPFYSDLARAPAGGQAHWVQAYDGIRLRLAHWRPDQAKGTVILCPGRTEYIEKYGSVVGEFTQAGLAVVVNDWRGQGLSDRMLPNRMLGHVDQFGDFQHDVTAIVAYAKAHNLPEPFHLVAHSMGGCITLRALMNGLDVQTATFSGPMWGIKLATHMRASAWAISALINPFSVRNHLSPGADARSLMDTHTFETNTLTTDPDEFAHMVYQLREVEPFNLGGPTIGWLHGALREMRNLSKLPAPDVPCLTFLGTDEQIVDPERIKTRMTNWTHGKLEIVPNGKHEIMMEAPAMRDRFFDLTLKHIGV